MPLNLKNNELLIRCSHCDGLSHYVLIRHLPENGSHDWRVSVGGDCHDSILVTDDEMREVAAFLLLRSSSRAPLAKMAAEIRPKSDDK